MQISCKHFFESKRKGKGEAMHIDETQRLVTEIEMLRVVLHLASRRKDSRSSSVR
jgi:hypothetical protein